MLAVDQWIQRAREAPIEAEILRRGIVLRKSGSERIGPCPKCGGTDRFSINVRDNVWNCRQCKPDDISGDVIGLVMHLDDCGFETAVETLTQEPKPNGHDDSNGRGTADNVRQLRREVAWYDYENENGEREFQVVRYEPKDFRPRYQDANGKWVYSRKGQRDIPFHLPELLEGIGRGVVYIVEGEKDVETMAKMGYVATTNQGGCNGWKPALNQYFERADVVIIADHDSQSINKKTGEKLFHPDKRPKLPGFDHAMHVAEQLAPLAERVRMFDIALLWRDCPSKGDVTDYFRNGGTVEALNAFVETLPDWSPNITPPADKPALVPLHRPFPLDETLLLPRDWEIPGLLMRKQVTVLVAPSGSGKSLLTLQVGIACALGVSWAGWRPRAQYRVLFINSEDDVMECKRRLAAMARVMQVSADGGGYRPLDQAYLSDRFFIADEDDGYLVASFDARTKTMKQEPMMQRLIDTIKANQIDVVFVDPFAETFAGDENSNSELKWAGVMWRRLARETNTAVCLVHHTKKYATGMAGDVDAARGAGALIGIARIVSTLFPMTTKEAELMKDKDDSGIVKTIGDERKHKYLRYDDAKANLNLKSAVAKWFRKETVTLHNANWERNQPGDEVGALVPFTPPGLFDQFTVDLIDAFFAKLEKGIFDSKGEFTGEYWTLDTRKQSEHEMSRYVGDLVMSHFGVEMEQAVAMLKDWQKAKRLAVSEYHSKRQRKARKRVMPSTFKASPDPNEEKAQEAFI